MRSAGERAARRILYISQFFHPLGVPCFTGYARALKEASHDVRVLATRLERSWSETDDYCGIKIDRIDPPAGRLGRVRYVIRFLRIALALQRPDLVIGNFLDIHGAIAIAVGWLRRVPTVIIEHGAGAHEAHTWLFRDRIFNVFCLHAARLVIVLSSDDKRLLLLRAPKLHVEVVPCPFFRDGAQLTRLQARKMIGLSGSEFHIVTAGRLVEIGGVEQKGVSVAIGALTRLPSCRLHVLGDGPLRLKLEAKAQELDVADRVTFHGQVARKTVDMFMTAADAVLVASAFEPLGMVVLEAMAARTPLVATNVGGPKDYLRPGVDALLVEPRDPEAISAAIQRLIDSPDLRDHLVENAVQRLAEYFEPRQVIARLGRALSHAGVGFGAAFPEAPEART